MQRAEVTLDDTFLLTEGRVFVTGVPFEGRWPLGRARGAGVGAK